MSREWLLPKTVISLLPGVVGSLEMNEFRRGVGSVSLRGKRRRRYYAIVPFFIYTARVVAEIVSSC